MTDKMKKVLIIGAGFLQDFVIRKTKSLGYETLAVDGNPDAVGFCHADKYKVINIVDEKIDKLASDILSNHLETMQILVRIDEINGILVDLIM